MGAEHNHYLLKFGDIPRFGSLCASKILIYPLLDWGFITPWELQVMAIPSISGRGSNLAQPFSVLNFLEVRHWFLVTKGYSLTHELMREDGHCARIRIELTIDWLVGILEWNQRFSTTRVDGPLPCCYGALMGQFS